MIGIGHRLGSLLSWELFLTLRPLMVIVSVPTQYWIGIDTHLNFPLKFKGKTPTNRSDLYT